MSWMQRNIGNPFEVALAIYAVSCGAVIAIGLLSHERMKKQDQKTKGVS